MGLNKESGGRRCQVHGYSAVVIPRCDPCKGHLSTQSNAFCIASARNLTSQYLIRDHMVFHYNRILSAKAAVDCSVPKSRLTCIKLADQQKRDKLKKITKCEEKLCVCEAVPRSCSRDNGRLPPSTLRTSLLEVEKNLLACAGHAQCLSRAPSAPGEHCLVHCSPVKHSRKCSRNTSRAYHSKSNVCLAKPGKRCVVSRSHSTESVVTVGCSKRCHRNNPRAGSGDLLERHSECFTKVCKPFTPRTLISDAKPSLPGYRYYTCARRKKKNHHRHCVEAQTQTDAISFPSGDKVYMRKVTSEQQMIMSEAEDKRCACNEPEREIDGCQCSSLRESSCCSRKSSPRRWVDAEEEELLYLTFIEDVTNEILRLGIFSNRALDQLFECYIEENKNRLDEGRMRQMLEVLKSDLGWGQDGETELIHASQESLEHLDLQEDVIEGLKFTRKGHSLRKTTKSEEFLETMDLPLKEPKKCESLSSCPRSTETPSREDSSEDSTDLMDAATESELCALEFEEHPNTSHACGAALSSIACDSDLELCEKLNELEEHLADLHFSHNYS